MKKCIILLIISGVILSLAGCGKKKDELTLEDYKSLSENYKTLYDDASDKVGSLEDILYAYDPTLPELADIEEAAIIPDGTESFLSVNGKIILKNTLEDDGYERIPNQSKVYLNDSVFVTPTDNWTVKMDGDSLKMEHSSSIYGEVKSYAYIGEFNGIDCYSGIVVPYLENLGIKKHVDTTLFVDGVRSGYNTASSIKIIDIDDEEEVADTTKEDATKADTTKADATKADTTKADATKADTTKEDTTKADTTKADTTKEDTTKEDTTKEDTTKAKKKKAPKKKNYALVFGVVIEDGKILMYQFTYEKSDNAVALQEIVNNTIKTMSVNGGYVGME